MIFIIFNFIIMFIKQYKKTKNSKENLKNSDVSLVGPNVNVAHILQGDYEWSY